METGKIALRGAWGTGGDCIKRKKDNSDKQQKEKETKLYDAIKEWERTKKIKCLMILLEKFKK